jgi:TatD DNase family protein
MSTTEKKESDFVQLFDSHCHLDDKSFEPDFNQVLERSQRAGVTRAMTIGIDENTSRRAVAIADRHPGVFASVGVHPHDAKNCSDAILNRLEKLTAADSVRAWGEIGLDFNRMYSPAGVQEKWMIRQLEIAERLDLPVIFHERDSNGRFLEIIKTHRAPGREAVIHCFSGTRAELDQYVNLDFYIGVTGILTIQGRGAALRELVGRVPKNRLVVETDAPYLTPMPERKQHRRNEPAFVKSVFRKLAAVLQEDPLKLSETLFENTCRLFRIASSDGDMNA